MKILTVVVFLVLFLIVAPVGAQHSKNSAVVLIQGNGKIGSGEVLKTEFGTLVVTNYHVKKKVGKFQIGKAKPSWSIDLTGPDDEGALDSPMMVGKKVRMNPLRDISFSFFSESPEQLGLTALEISFTHPKVGDPVSFFGYRDGMFSASEDSKVGLIKELDPRILVLSFFGHAGNSGGPLLDREGRVVGIITGVNGMDFAKAIPMSVLFRGVLANPKLKDLFSNEDLLKMEIFIAEREKLFGQASEIESINEPDANSNLKKTKVRVDIFNNEGRPTLVKPNPLQRRLMSSMKDIWALQFDQLVVVSSDNKLIETRSEQVRFKGEVAEFRSLPNGKKFKETLSAKPGSYALAEDDYDFISRLERIAGLTWVRLPGGLNGREVYTYRAKKTDKVFFLDYGLQILPGVVKTNRLYGDGEGTLVFEKGMLVEHTQRIVVGRMGIAEIYRKVDFRYAWKLGTVPVQYLVEMKKTNGTSLRALGTFQNIKQIKLNLKPIYVN